MNKLLKVVVSFSVVFMSMILSGCYTFMDTSPRGLQQMWLEWVRDGAMGKNIYKCKNTGVRKEPCGISHGGYKPVSSKTLPNGNIEDEYLFSNRCFYFYEYEVDTGRIVGFRYEETRQYDCRVSGV